MYWGCRMMITNNEVCKPTKSPQTDAITTRCLTILLDGGTLNRKTLGDMEITVNNASLHSIVSILRNERLIPIESKRVLDNTCDYYMEQKEITRYKNPNLRKQQCEEMRIHVEKKREKKIIGMFLKLLWRLDTSQHPWHHLENLPQKLDEIGKEINALLTNKKGVY
jgi:hypothetical protein